MNSDRIETVAKNGCHFIQTHCDKDIDKICEQNDVAVVIKLKTPYMTDIIRQKEINYISLNYKELDNSIIIPTPNSTKEIIVDQHPVCTTIVIKKGDNE